MAKDTAASTGRGVLIVIRETENKTRRRQVLAIGAAVFLQRAGIASAIEPAMLQRFDQLIQSASKVLVVAF